MVDGGGQDILLGDIQHLVHGVHQNTQLDTAHIQDDDKAVLLGGLAKAQTDIEGVFAMTSPAAYTGQEAEAALAAKKSGGASGKPVDADLTLPCRWYNCTCP